MDMAFFLWGLSFRRQTPLYPNPPLRQREGKRGSKASCFIDTNDCICIFFYHFCLFTLCWLSCDEGCGCVEGIWGGGVWFKSLLFKKWSRVGWKLGVFVALLVGRVARSEVYTGGV